MISGRTARLSATAAAPSIARYRARETCRTAHVPAPQREIVAIIAGELVGVSVRQARTALDLDITVEPGRIEIRIREVPAAGRLLPGGLSTARSLELVRRLAQTWGIGCVGDERVLWAIVPFVDADARASGRSRVLVGR